MAINNKRIFGLAVTSSLTDVVNRRTSLKNLGFEQRDLEIIRGISSEGFDRNDLQTISTLSEPIWKLFDRYTTDVNTYSSTLTLSGGVDTQLRGNLTVSGGLSATAFRYKILDTEPDPEVATATPILKWGDISTSRVSSWSTIGTTISYGADVKIQGKIQVGKLRTRTLANKRTFSSEIPTHKIRIDIGELTDTGDPRYTGPGTRDIRYIYAMRGIPLRFKAFFRSFTATVGFIPDSLNNKLSWRIYRPGDSEADYQDFPDLGGASSSTIQYESPTQGAERFIEIYYTPDNITSISIPNNNIRELPKVSLNNLKVFNFDNNGLTDFPNFREFSPNLESLSINNNNFFNSSISTERKFNLALVPKLPQNLKTLNLRGSFVGGLEQGVFLPFTFLREVNLRRSRGYFFYPDSTNSTGEVPLFSDGTPLETFDISENDFRTFGSSRNITIDGTTYTGVTVKDINTLTSFDVSENGSLLDNNFSLSSNNIQSVNISNTQLRCPNLSSRISLTNFIADGNDNFGSLYEGWDGTFTNYPTPTTTVLDSQYKFSNCISLSNIDISSSNVSGFIPKFAGNNSLKSIDLRGCNNLVAGRPGKETDIKCLYGDTFEGTVVETLLLSINNPNFSGPIDSETFVPIKDTIKTLYLFASGRFTGDFPDLSSAPNLVDVRSSNEQWTGEVPSFGSSFSLQRIELQGNNFSGKIEYTQKNSLNYIDYSSNNITSISRFCFLPGLQKLYASNNSLGGTLPEFDTICENVEIISLNNNGYTSYNGGLVGLFRLKELDLSLNNLSESAVDDILDDLVENASIANGSKRRVIINLRGNSPPSPFPTISGIITSVNDDPATINPTLQNGDIISLGNASTLDGPIPDGYVPVDKTYPSLGLSYVDSGDGVNASVGIDVSVDKTEGIVTSIGTFTTDGNDFNVFANGTYTLTDTGSKSLGGSGAQIQVVVSGGQAISCTLVSGGSGYQEQSIIVISKSQLGYTGSEEYDLEIEVNTIKEVNYNSISYEVIKINIGGSNYSLGDTLRTSNLIEFVNSAGNIINGYIFFNVDGITQRQDTNFPSGVGVAEELRKIGWTISVEE